MILWTVGCQAPSTEGFPRQKYWSGLPFLPPGDLPDPGIEPASPVLAGSFFITEPKHPINIAMILKWGNEELFIQEIKLSKSLSLSVQVFLWRKVDG